MVFATTVQLSNHQGIFIKVPSSSYSDQKIVLNGNDDDWKSIKKNDVIFEGIPPGSPLTHNPSNNNNNSLLGNIMVRNNESHLAIFMDLKTPYPIQDPFRRIMLPFDENGDGR